MGVGSSYAVVLCLGGDRDRTPPIRLPEGRGKEVKAHGEHCLILNLVV